MLKNETEKGAIRQELKETLQMNENMLAELLKDDDDVFDGVRRSEHVRKPTEKLLAYCQKEQSQREKKLASLYEQWKALARRTRQDLKYELTEKHLASLADELEKAKVNVLKIFDELRARGTPNPELRRKVDACVAVTGDIMRIINERLTGINGEYDAEHEGARCLRELLEPDYARSIYGSASELSRHSHHSSVVAKRAEVAANLAAKEAEYKVLLAAKARFKAYDREVKEESDAQSFQSFRDPLPHNHIPLHAPTQLYQAATPPSPIDVSCLAQAVQDSIAINRLPMPEPTVFNGNPIDFIEWKASFMALIDRKNISTADKLHYLKRYVAGSAQKCLEGTFYGSDDAAYSDAWNKLNQRYGQPFIIQKAFREKLSNWPKIQGKDAEGLRNFSDFLNACLQAMPHVKGLNILNDCEENQKLIRKLPEWLASRWNRQVTVRLTEGKDFPSFKEFAKFMSMEAEPPAIQSHLSSLPFCRILL